VRLERTICELKANTGNTKAHAICDVHASDGGPCRKKLGTGLSPYPCRKDEAHPHPSAVRTRRSVKAYAG
jgi:hypothetical protein